jgi:hypothetical protein
MTHSQEIDRAKDDYRAGLTDTVVITKAAFESIHPDFRNDSSSPYYPACLVLTKEGTCSVPVSFAEERRSLVTVQDVDCDDLICWRLACGKEIPAGHRALRLQLADEDGASYEWFCSHACAKEAGAFDYPEQAG